MTPLLPHSPLVNKGPLSPGSCPSAHPGWEAVGLLSPWKPSETKRGKHGNGKGRPPQKVDYLRTSSPTKFVLILWLIWKAPPKWMRETPPHSPWWTRDCFHHQGEWGGVGALLPTSFIFMRLHVILIHFVVCWTWLDASSQRLRGWAGQGIRNYETVPIILIKVIL